MGDESTRYTAEHTAKEFELEIANLRAQARTSRKYLDNQIEVNIALLRDLREIKKTFWYKLGRLLCLIP